MRKRQLGSSGLEVSAIGYGAMPLSLEGRPKRAVAVSVIEEVLAGAASTTRPRREGCGRRVPSAGGTG